MPTAGPKGVATSVCIRHSAHVASTSAWKFLVSYYTERPQIAALVPEAARVVLDVGCGEGALGRMLKRNRPEVVVLGIEPLPDVAAVAGEHLDAVQVGGAEGGWPMDWPAPDCIVFADSLEHMVDPWSVLARSVARLAPGGSVVFSMPNVAHHSVLVGGLRGRWDYADHGLLDRTHLRFFTRLTLLELVRGAGLEPTVIQRLCNGPWAQRLTHRYGQARRWLTGDDRSAYAARASIIDLLTHQYLMLAHRQATATTPAG